MSQSFDVAIVLGAKLLPDGSPGPALRRRVLVGVELARTGRASHLLLSGGPVAHPTSEAEAMRQLAVAEGIAPERIAVETRSLNTIQNARLSAPIIAEKGWRRLAVVTDLAHLPRALYVFHRFGLRASGIPAFPVGQDCWLGWAREVMALPWTVLRVERELWPWR